MEDVHTALIHAVKEIFPAVCKHPVVAKPPVTCTPSEPYQAEISVIIGVLGEIDGTLAFRCSRALAAEITGIMLGIKVAPESDEIKDAIGEFFNMIVGSVKRFLASEHDPFTMSVPTTIVGTDYAIFVNTEEQTRFVRIPLIWNSHEAVIEVHLNR